MSSSPRLKEGQQALRLPVRKKTFEGADNVRQSLVFSAKRRGGKRRDSTTMPPPRPERKRSKESYVLELRRLSLSRRGSKKTKTKLQKQESLGDVSMLSDDFSLSSIDASGRSGMSGSGNSKGHNSLVRMFSQSFFFRVNKPEHDKDEEEQPTGESEAEKQETESLASSALEKSVELSNLEQENEPQESKQRSRMWFSSSRLLSKAPSFSLRTPKSKKKQVANMDSLEITVSPFKTVQSLSRRLPQRMMDSSSGRSRNSSCRQTMDHSSGRNQGRMDNSSNRNQVMDASEITLSPIKCSSHCRRAPNRATTGDMNSSEISGRMMDASEDTLSPIQCRGVQYPGRRGRPAMPDWDEENSEEVSDEVEKSPEPVKKTRSARYRLVLKTKSLRFRSSAPSKEETLVETCKNANDPLDGSENAQIRTQPNRRGVPRTKEGGRGSNLLQRMATGRRTTMTSGSASSRDRCSVEDVRRSRLTDMDVPEVRNKRKQYDSLPSLPEMAKSAVAPSPSSNGATPQKQPVHTQQKSRPMMNRGYSLRLPSKRLLTRLGSARAMAQSTRTLQ